MPPLSELGGTNLLRQFIALSRGLIKSANGWYHQDSSGRLVRRTFVCGIRFSPAIFLSTYNRLVVTLFRVIN